MGTTAASTGSATTSSFETEGGPARPIIRVALIGTGSSPPDVVKALLDASDWCICEPVEQVSDERPSALRRFDVAVLVDQGGGRPSKGENRSPEQDRQLGLLQRSQVGVLVITSRHWRFAGGGAGTVCLSPASSIERVQGVLLALAQSRPVLRQIDRQLTNLRRLSETLQKQFEATDHELRLASRLQRDFLPRELPREGRLTFRTIFRPCTWVSGDIFDVFRLDEQHWGFYLADAVGHGVAAGLLTMYIKHAIRPKRIFKGGYELVPPSEVMGMLNDQLASQELADSQFITGWYGMINTETLELRYAIAGHPPPMLIDREGGIRELHGEGSLLGLYCGQQFSDESAALRPGERVILYSDGLEPTLITHRPPLPQMPTLAPGMEALVKRPGEEIVTCLRERLDNEAGSLQHADDVTVVVLDIAEEGDASAR